MNLMNHAPDRTHPDTVTIRPCAGVEEFLGCVHLQQQVWQFPDLDVVPVRMFVVAEKVGGQVIGAFSGDDLVGFVLALPGLRSGHTYLHSHMLGVRAEFRDHGVGRRLKLAQREDALTRGIDLIEWTFDPLEIKNAYLNIERLGAIARRYNVDQYGSSASPLQGGLPTDRLIAEWWLRSKRVAAAIATHKVPHTKTVASIAVPEEIYRWKASEAERHKARAVQMENRTAFLRAFAQGLSVVEFERDALGNGTFQLGRWDETHED